MAKQFECFNCGVFFAPASSNATDDFKTTYCSEECETEDKESITSSQVAPENLELSPSQTEITKATEAINTISKAGFVLNMREKEIK